MEDEGFVVNPYDPCVVNKVTIGKKMTVTWHVDDLKVSHVEEAKVKKFGDFLKANFKKNDLKVTHHHCHVHAYLGISLDYSKKEKFKISMIMYLYNMLNDFSEKLGKPFAYPATDHLFSD